MKNFPYDEIGNLVKLLHETNGKEPWEDDYIYTVTVYPSSRSYQVLVNNLLFRKLVDSLFDITVTFHEEYESVHISAYSQGVIFVTCILKGEMLTCFEDSKKSIEQLYAEYCERNDWPYVQKKKKA